MSNVIPVDSAIVELTDDQRAIRIAAETWPERARSIQIADDFGYADAGALLQGVKALMREADDIFDGPVRKAHEAHKAILTAKKSVTAPLEEAEKILKRGMADYHAVQERVRQGEQRRLQEIADQQAKEARAAAIAAASAVGPRAFFEAIADPAPLALAVEVKSHAPKMAGISTRLVWKPEVTDKLALLRWIVETAPTKPYVLGWVSFDNGWLTGVPHDDAGGTDVPGLRFKSEVVIASR